MPALSISIAMATFNGQRHLERQLTSLAGQTCLPAELVVSDDGSDDETVRIVEAFAAEAPFPVRVAFNPARLGWRGNFIAASERCTGDLVAFCDQDDEWYPQKLATLLPSFDDPEVLLAFHDADLIDDAGRRYGSLWPVTQVAGRIPRLSRPTSWSNPLGLTQVFRRTLTRFNALWSRSTDHYTPEQRAAHDQWFYFLATNLGDVVAYPDRLIGYRQHGNNAVGWETKDKTARPLREELARSVAMLASFVAVLREAAGIEANLEWRDRLLAAAAQNERLLERLRLRLSLHRASRFVERVRVAATLVGARAYDQESDWGLGRRALIVDTTLGLFSGGRG